MKNQINVTLTNIDGDTITLEDIISINKNILNFQKKYFIESLKINLNKLQLMNKDIIFEKFGSISSAKIFIIKDTIEEISFSKNMYLYDDKSLNHIQFHTRPYPKIKVQ